MNKIEIFGMLMINILMWGIALVDPRGVAHFTTALVIGAVGPILIQVLACVIKRREMRKHLYE